ncbi:hypothetical protein ACTFIY_009455 [Dictyostelium cf. discoideum]
MDELINYCNTRYIKGIIKFYDFDSISHGSIYRTCVKQGDPLSPTLFVLVIESLARTILNDNNIKGLPLNNREQREKFQSFADDSATMVTDTDQLDIVRDSKLN